MMVARSIRIDLEWNTSNRGPMDRGSNVIPACRPVHTLNQNPSNNDHSNPQKIPSKTLTIF